MSSYPNKLLKPIQLGRYNRILINVLRAANLPDQLQFYVVLKINDATHTTRISTEGPNPTWSPEDFIAPICYGSILELSVFHERQLLGQHRVVLNRMISFIGPASATARTCTLRLRNPSLPRDHPLQYSTSITIHATRLPPFVAKSLSRYHLSPTLLTVSAFNVSDSEVEHILATMEPLDFYSNFASLGESLIVKFGPEINTREAMAMMHIQQKTSIPTPKVHQCFVRNNVTYIVMDRIKGQPLEDCVSSMTPKQLRTIAIQLAGFVQQLRSLNPQQSMGSWPSGPYDNTFFEPAPLHKFYNMKEFHSYWIWRLGSYMALPEVPSALREGRPCNIVLTHGDLAPRNIMVDDGEITGILDWETLGWYPEFWELMAATRYCPSTDWRNELVEVLGPESELSRQYGEVLHEVLSRMIAQ